MKRHPILFSACILILIVLINRIPLNGLFESIGWGEFKADAVENLIFNSIICVGVIYIIKVKHIPVAIFSNSFQHFWYYTPMILYLFIFSGGTSVSDFAKHESDILFLYGTETFISAFLEEFLFRGLILGLLLLNYSETKHGIFKSVFYSALIFGGIHVINFFTQPDTPLMSVFNQIYATACLGFMYGAVYLKTRSLFILVLIHFLSNFIAGIGDINNAAKVFPSETIDSFFTEILEEVIRLVIYGIPFLVGIYILNKTDKQELTILLR